MYSLVMNDTYGDPITLRVCNSEPGGPIIEISVEGAEETAYSALSRKKARKLALALLKWSESDG